MIVTDEDICDESVECASHALNTQAAQLTAHRVVILVFPLSGLREQQHINLVQPQLSAPQSITIALNVESTEKYVVFFIFQNMCAHQCLHNGPMFPQKARC